MTSLRLGHRAPVTLPRVCADSFTKLPMKKLIRFVLALIVVQVPLIASSQTWLSKLQGSASQMEWQFSPYTYHFSYSEEHRPVVMVGLERSYADGSLDGMTLFSNSFGQECTYIYPWGQVYKNLFGVQPLSFKWTAG